MSPPAGRLARTLELIDRYFEEVFAVILLAIMATLVFLQVVMRYLFANPLSWTDEIAIYCMVWLVYIGASLGVRECAHIRVLQVLFLLPCRLGVALLMISDAIWLGLNGLMIWQGVVLDLSMWERTYLSPALGLPQKWPYLIVPLGFLLMSLRLLQLYGRWLRRGGSPLDAYARTRAEGGEVR